MAAAAKINLSEIARKNQDVSRWLLTITFRASRFRPLLGNRGNNSLAEWDKKLIFFSHPALRSFLSAIFPLRKMLSGEPLKSPLKTLEGISSHLFREETIKESSLKTFSFQNYDNARGDGMFVIISPF